MFTLYHFIWLAISTAAIVIALSWLVKHKPPIKSVLTVACIGCICSELLKIFSVIQMVPDASGETMHLYVELQNLPLHLCSLQIISIYCARFMKEGKARDVLLGFMYPTCVAGAFFALLLPSIFDADTTAREAFLDGHPYEYFLYHSMLIILGLYIFLSKQVDLKPRHCLTTFGMLAAVAFFSIYTNSMFSHAVYKSDELVSVEYTPNFFFVFDTPIGIKLTEMWHWYVYLAILLTLASLLIVGFYVPVFRRAKRAKTEEIVVTV